MIETVLSRSVRMMFSGSAAVVIGLTAQSALAQDAPAAPMQRVEITGSAIKRIDAETAVPVTVIRMDELKKQGVTTVEQVMANLSVSQSQYGTSQVVGLSTGGAAFADLRGIGENKTLVLLNGRRLANNAFDSSAPDLNMIPFAALERVEVLRDGASALYGSDAVGGVINFITRKDFQGGSVTVGADKPEHKGGKSNNINAAFGAGSLANDGWNLFAVLDHQKQRSITGLQRDFNKRYPGGLSPTPFPANYYQDDQTGNPAAPSCTSAPNLIPGSPTNCQMTTSSFVDYIPSSERTTGLAKATMKVGENHQFSVEFMASESTVKSQIAPVPYGGLVQNRLRPNGTPNPYYPGNGTIGANIPLSPTFDDGFGGDGARPGFIYVKWRDLPNGPRADENINKQQRFVAALSGLVGGWDYEGALTFNQNKVKENLSGYSDGGIITAGVLNGIINPFGEQDAAGTALIESAALNGNIMNAKGTTVGADFHMSREMGDWMGAGRQAAVAVGVEAHREKFLSAANPVYAEKVISSTGIDPNSRDEGKRNVYAAYVEVNVPLLKDLDLTAALRYDKYSDFGNTTNPKVGFRYQPTKQVLLRGSYSEGFRAPSLYDINSSQAYTNTTQQDDPVNCPGGTAIPGKSTAANCAQQFQSLTGGNKNLDPETSRNLTIGLVLEPVDNLTLGLDFWGIDLKHSIDELNQDEVFGNPVQYAAVFHRNASGNLATDGSQCPNPATCGYVDLRTQNLGGIKTFGVDVSGNYKLKTSTLGTFAFVSNSTFVDSYKYQNTEDGDWKSKLGRFSGKGTIFRWQHNVQMNWSMREFGAGVSAHHKTGYLDMVDDDHPGHRVAPYTTVDAFLSYTMAKGFGITAGVRNLADRAPPLSYQTETFQAGFDPRYADPIGRVYYVRASYSF